MRPILPIALLIATGCVQAQEQRVGQVPDAAEPAAYVVNIVDDEWDRVEYGYVKVRDIEMPAPNLEACSPGSEGDLFRKVEAEAAAELARLNEMDWHHDGWQEREYIVTDEGCFQAADALIAFVQLRTLEREYGAAAVGLLRTDQELLLFAEADPYMQDLTLVAYDLINDLPMVYGHRRGSPAQPHGGDFELAFQENKRIIRYSYFEQTQ